MEHLSDNILNKGISIGEKRNQEESALRMLKAGKYGDEEIADISGLKLNDVVNLKKQLLN